MSSTEASSGEAFSFARTPRGLSRRAGGPKLRALQAGTPGPVYQTQPIPMDDRRDPARSLWPWAVFAALLCAGVVLFFMYVPR